MKKTALITGASSGIGKEFSKIHAEKGGDLIVIARSENKLNELKKELEQQHNIDVLVLPKDLTKPNAAKEVYELVQQKGLKVDYLINNAGFGGLGMFNERELEQDLQMINLNISVLTALTHYFLQDFVNNNQGRILNVSSTASLMPGPLQAVYYATKAYVTSFSNALAEELHNTNITVTNLMPGATATEFGRISGMDKTELFKKTATARRVAQDGYEGMLKGKLDVISGLTSAQKLMSAMLPLTPKKMILKQVRQMHGVN
ncbi:SDR family NAD(P)-dependent oxidoreductase [Psychroflexus maritimus]|uniref:SDR family oxidoreductase n=1 Tax=Psychroflexus maritimus TaxID=2714865 RepID=A0A967AG03_9FLAO|nr:SDR family oxidoreductase [Psychroflexus maritimus]NGZ89821.1 SDR family oxidoreductase [Psychroflexus maritimus]